MHKKFDLLVIDDEQVIIDSILKLCSAEDFTVDTAIDATIALKKLSKNTYRLIICDIMMPDVDGFQFLEQMAAEHDPTPLIMTSGYSTVENAVKSLHTGAIDFLPKPFTVDELLSVVYRGLKYGDINQSIITTDSDLHQANNSIFYVSCPANYYRLGYSSWLKMEYDGSVKIGVSDLFLRTISPISKINFFNLDEEIIQGSPCAHIETEDNLIHQLLAPITGRIIEKNEQLAAQTDLIVKDPYFKGWIYTIIPSDLEYELKHLTACSSDRI